MGWDNSLPSQRLPQLRGSVDRHAGGQSIAVILDLPQKRDDMPQLDLVRGLAAIAVLVYHIRFRFFLDWADLTDRGIVPKLFYAATSFGHDAVIVFFVLSGFFISRIVIRDVGANAWSWRDYLLNRCVRLYVVLLPGLVLTALWDSAGLTFFPDNPLYSGTPQPWLTDSFPVHARLTTSTLLGNVAFAQSILVPPFGSNVSLWSLSFEFWYYVLFPCLWIAASRYSGPWRRTLYGIGAIVILWLIGPDLRGSFPIWLMGTAIALVDMSWMTGRPGKRCGILALLAFGCLLLTLHGPLAWTSLIVKDYLVGAAFAGLLLTLLTTPLSKGISASVARRLAGVSYTMYVAHLPLLVFLGGWLVPGKPWTPDLPHLIDAALVFVAVSAYCVAIGRWTEAKTSTIRRLFSTRPRALRWRESLAAVAPAA